MNCELINRLSKEANTLDLKLLDLGFSQEWVAELKHTYIKIYTNHKTNETNVREYLLDYTCITKQILKGCKYE